MLSLFIYEIQKIVPRINFLLNILQKTSKSLWCFLKDLFFFQVSGFLVLTIKNQLGNKKVTCRYAYHTLVPVGLDYYIIFSKLK